MCQFFSGLITKNKTWFELDSDRHEDLIIKAGLKDDSRSPDFVRVELLPKDGNIFNHDLKNWTLRVDQDYRPNWFKTEWAEAEMKKAIKQVFAERFIINDKSNQRREKQRLFIKNSSVEAWGNSSVEAWENSSVEARENSSVEARENSSVVARENSSVVAWGNSSVVARGNSSVVAWGNSSVEARGNSSVVARGNSSVVIPYSKDIKIKGIYDYATVKDVSGKPILYVASNKIKKVIFKLPKKTK